MKKVMSLIITLVFVFSAFLPVAMADGIGDNQTSNYPGVTDYRYHQVSDNPNHQRPYAGFSIQIMSRTSLSNETYSGNYDLETEISSAQDSPVIQARVGDSIVINDRSTPGSGGKITQYDIQYRFTPAGQNREDYEIHPAIVSSWSQVKNIIENLPLDQPGTYEIYMAVADNAKCLPGAVNWSANGNVRVINKNNPNFPNGIFWYFTSAAVEVEEERPDFFPTPEGSSEWQESYLECAATYVGEPGEQITFPVNLYNIGSKGSTDFRAVWEGQGNDPSAGWKGSNAPFIATGTSEDGKETNLITLGKEEFETFEVTVTVPDQFRKLYFKANTDGKTPVNEQVLDNNTMVILIGPDGIDLEINSPPVMQKGALKGQQVSVDVLFTYFRIDGKEVPVEAEVTWDVTKNGTPIDGGSKTVTLPLRTLDKQVVTVTGQPYDTFIVTGEIMPTTEKDLNLSNNKSVTKVYITEIFPHKDPPATKEDPSPGTRVNLRD